MSNPTYDVEHVFAVVARMGPLEFQNLLTELSTGIHAAGGPRVSREALYDALVNLTIHHQGGPEK